MIKTLLKTLLLLASIGYLVFALLKVSRSPQEMVCTGVEYMFTDSAQNILIDKGDVEKYLGQHKITLKGKTLADIDIRQLEHLLSENPYIDTATCYHTASGKLCFRITPQHPLLHIFANDGDEFYVSTKGSIIPAGGRNADLPIITGHATRKYASTKLLTLGRLLQEDAYWREQAQQVNIDQKGNIEIIPRFSDQTILLGAPRDIAEKLRHVRLFYEKSMPKTGWNKYRIINAQYGNQIICTKK